MFTLIDRFNATLRKINIQFGEEFVKNIRKLLEDGRLQREVKEPLNSANRTSATHVVRAFS